MTNPELGAMTPEDRILLAYREAVAQATARALADLRAVGVADPIGLLTRAPHPASPSDR